MKKMYKKLYLGLETCTCLEPCSLKIVSLQLKKWKKKKKKHQRPEMQTHFRPCLLSLIVLVVVVDVFGCVEMVVVTFGCIEMVVEVVLVITDHCRRCSLEANKN